jgi:hypothetical protein
VTTTHPLPTRSPRWVVITPQRDRPNRALVIGPFATLTEAKDYGRRYHPDRHRVVGLHRPRRRRVST